MTEVILFHHALGVTEGVTAFADQLRDGGHQVTEGDLFGGATFGTIEEGVAYEEQLGWNEMILRSEAAIAPLPRAVVIGGFSLGAVYGQRLAQTRAGALGALLFHGGDIPSAEFALPWPEGVGLQVHVSEGDKWFNREGGEQLVAEGPAPNCSSIRARPTCSRIARGRSTTKRRRRWRWSAPSRSSTAWGSARRTR